MSQTALLWLEVDFRQVSTIDLLFHFRIDLIEIIGKFRVDPALPEDDFEDLSTALQGFGHRFQLARQIGAGLPVWWDVCGIFLDSPTQRGSRLDAG